MKIRFLLIVLLCGWSTSIVHAQHSDIELGYDNLSTPNVIVVAADQFTADGLMLFEGEEFHALDPFSPDDLGAENPGFATNPVHPGGPLLVNPGDEIFCELLDASEDSAFGVGYVNYYNPGTDMLEPTGRIRFDDNSVGTSHLVLNGAIIESGTNPQYVDVGNSSGEIHDHLTFDLLDESSAPDGAYGILCQLVADFAPADGTIDVMSEPFWIVFNKGMTEADFESLALPKFGIGASVEVSPLSMTVNTGVLVGGSVDALTDSDNVDVTVRRSSQTIASVVEFDLTADSPIDRQGVTTLEFEYEASVFSRGPVTQIISMFDYDTGTFEHVDSRAAARFSDSTVVITPGGDVSRFVEPGTGEMMARIRYVGNSPRLQFSVNADFAAWRLSN